MYDVAVREELGGEVLSQLDRQAGRHAQLQPALQNVGRKPAKTPRLALELS